MISSENQSGIRLYDVALESKEHGLVTKADCIIFNKEKNEGYPVQHKYSYKPKVLYRGYIIQLLMEGLMIEEQFGVDVPHGFIVFERSKETVQVDLSDKQKVLYSINAVRDIIQGEQFPPPTEWRKRCVDCCYNKLCWG
jgi:CRISPR-associated exonuclease Cas4